MKQTKRRRMITISLLICLAGAAVATAACTLFLSPGEAPVKQLRPVHVELSGGRQDSSEPDEPPEASEPPEPEPPKGGKTAYLTFDDGPTPNTPEVLQILREHGATATFFTVFHKDSDTYYQQIADSGCQLAIHGYTHNYKALYASIDSYFADFYKMQDYLRQFTDDPLTDFRFPGGSSQTVTDERTFCGIILETRNRGLRYVDWNVSAQDATNRPINAGTVFNNIIPAAFQHDQPVILMHERVPYTREALPWIIEALKEQGYQFGLIKDLEQPVQHRTPDYAAALLAG